MSFIMSWMKAAFALIFCTFRVPIFNFRFDSFMLVILSVNLGGSILLGMSVVSPVYRCRLRLGRVLKKSSCIYTDCSLLAFSVRLMSLCLSLLCLGYSLYMWLWVIIGLAEMLAWYTSVLGWQLVCSSSLSLTARSRRFRILARKIEFGVFGLFRMKKNYFREKTEDFDEFPYFFRI